MSMFDVRRADTRGVMQLDWLDARFSFSFGAYRNPRRDPFGALLALNEDRIQPKAGFPPHPHEDLEIFILPLSGAVEHRDNLGNHVIVEPGQMQKLRAGQGIWHSQSNPSPTQVDHHLQIWLRPRTRGLAPALEQRAFARADRCGTWQELVTPDGRGASLSVDQDATIRAAILDFDQELHVRQEPGRSTYLHVVSGAIAMFNHDESGAVLAGGDALALTSSGTVHLRGRVDGSEVLWFDLPAFF